MSNYWEKRYRLLESETYNLIKSGKTEIAKINKKLSRRLESDVLYWIARFADNNDLTLLSAQETLDNGEMKDFKYTLKDYIEHGDAGYISPEWKDILENMSIRYHYTRENAIRTILRHYSELFIGLNYETIRNTLVDAYTLNYYKSYYEIAKGVGVELSFVGVNKEKLEILLSRPWTKDGLEFSQRLWGNKRPELVGELYNELTTQLTRGSNPKVVAAELARKFEVKKNVAENILTTETAHIAETARNKTFEELGVKEYIIVATLDLRTSDICQNMDGKIFKTRDKVTGVNSPPFHCRCRTTTAPYFEDLYRFGQRAARSKAGKTIFVPRDMKYSDWYNTYIDSKKK